MAIEESEGSGISSEAGIHESILAAIRQEIGEGRKQIKSKALAIDGIRHIGNDRGRFVYRLILSDATTFRADQELKFHARNTSETISATVISSDDDGLVITASRPLPVDAKLLNFKFDPAFILNALGEFLSSVSPSVISQKFLRKELLASQSSETHLFDHLNREQSAAIFEMTEVPIRLLFGPPGTGKTTTLGRAIAEWYAQGKSILVVSTANKAVDTAMRKIMDSVPSKHHRKLLRIGATTDEAVQTLTLAGKMGSTSPKWAANIRETQDRLSELSEMLSFRTNSDQRFQQLYSEYARLEAELSRESHKADGLLKQVLPYNKVVGCTLAKMVLDKDLREKKFDIVVVDEASMVSLVFAFCASSFARENLVLAGDPKQLPPICQSKFPEAKTWFGMNCYDWLGAKEYSAKAIASELRTQYRMTEEIGGIVSRLSYGNCLEHGRQECGQKVSFIDMPPEWQTTYYSVSEGSYFHLSSIPLVKEVAETLAQDKGLLLLTPFRPQRSLLSALAFDLREQNRELDVTASTIHQSQGSECETVILDLTTHRIDKLVAFFRDKHCSNLFNVGISRAKNRLFILGNRNMIRVLSREHPFWGDLLVELDNRIETIPASHFLEEACSSMELGRVAGTEAKGDFPVMYSHQHGKSIAPEILNCLRNAGTGRRLLVLPEDGPELDDDGLIVRHGSDLPSVFSVNGYVAVPYQDGWLQSYSPSVSQVIWRIGYSHLADDEVKPTAVRRFFCPECANGELALKRVSGEGWFLVCSNGRYSQCYYKRRLSLEDAKAKVRLAGMSCPKGHPLTARQGGRSIFLGCENYPECDYAEKLSLLEGM